MSAFATVSGRKDRERKFEGSKYKCYSFMMFSKDIQKTPSLYFYLLIKLKKRLLKARRWMIFMIRKSI